MNDTDSRFKLRRMVIIFAWLVAAVSLAVLVRETENFRRTRSLLLPEVSSEYDFSWYEGKKYEAEASKSVSAVPESTYEQTTAALNESEFEKYIINVNSKKIHTVNCPLADKIKEENRFVIDAADLDYYLNDGYTFCGSCGGE